MNESEMAVDEDVPTTTVPAVEDGAETAGTAFLDEETEKNRRRAARFGVEFVEPKPKKDIRKEFIKDRRSQTSFKTNMDIYSEEQLAKRASRAAKFGIKETAPVYVPAAVADDEDEQKKRDRAARFGTQYQAPDQTGLKNADVLEERKEHGAAVERRPEGIYLYGVDRLSTKEVLQYFADYAPSYAEWIDDSSCVVVFGDEFSAKRAIVGRGQPLGPGEAPDLQGLDPADIKNLPYLWHRGPDFEKQGSKPGAVPLIYRMATVADKKGMAPTKASRFLWLPKGQNQKVGKKRKPTAADDEGDVAMVDVAGGKGAAKRQRRAEKRRAKRATDVDMENAEEMPTDEAIVPKPAAEPELDPEQFLKAKEKQRAEGPSGLFSAAKAGILPDFLVPEGAADAQNGDAGSGESA